MAKETEQTSPLPRALPQPYGTIWAKPLPSLRLRFPHCLFVLLAVALGRWSPVFILRRGQGSVGAGESPVALL